MTLDKTNDYTSSRSKEQTNNNFAVPGPKRTLSSMELIVVVLLLSFLHLMATPGSRRCISTLDVTFGR